jgi:hypothetical protein
VILNLLFWLAHFIFILLLAYLSLEFVRSGRFSLDLGMLMFLWIFYSTSSLMAFGLVGWLTPAALGISSLMGIMILLGFRGSRRKIARLPSSCHAFRSGLRSWWSDLPGWLRWLVGMATLFSLVRFVFLIWALPPFVWDSLTYHLTNVGQWIQDGRIGIFPTSTARIYSPANYEVLATWFGVFIHHDIVLEASGLPAYLLGGVSVYALTRGLGGRQLASTVASISYLSAPAFLFAVTNTKNDPYIAAVYLLCGAIIVTGLQSQVTFKPRKPVGMFAILIVAILFALGTKTYMLHISIGLGLLGLGMLVRGRKQRSPGQVLTDAAAELKTLERCGKWTLLFLAGLALFLGSYWYVRNLIQTGTPFFPYSVRIEGDTVLEGEGNVFDLSPENFLYNLRAFGSKFGDKQYRIVPDLSNTTGWGWVLYGMGLAATIWAAQKIQFRILLAGFLTSFLFIAMSLPRSPWNLRYVIWLPAVIAVGLGLFFEFAHEWPQRQRKALIGLFVFCLGMNAALSLTYNLIPLESFRAMLALPAMEREAGKLHVQVPVEYESVYQYVPKDATLGYNLHENGFVYPLLRADLSQDLAYIPLTAAATCEQIAGEMRAHNTRYLFVAPVHTEDYVIGILESCATSGEVLRERAPGLFVIEAHDQ